MPWSLLLLYVPLYASLLGVCAVALSGAPRARDANTRRDLSTLPPWSRAA